MSLNNYLVKLEVPIEAESPEQAVCSVEDTIRNYECYYIYDVVPEDVFESPVAIDTESNEYRRATGLEEFE